MRAHGLGRFDVCVTHEPSRQVRSDRKKRDANGLAAPRDLLEVISPSRVAREIDVAGARRDHESTPQISIPIRHAARGKMLCRNDSDRTLALPPVQLRGHDAVTLHQGCVAEGSDDLRAGQTLQRRHVEMIVMIVADQNDVDGRKVLEANSRRSMTFWAGKAERRNALGPHRIGEDVHPINLNERGRMIDERDAELAVADTLRRRRAVRRVHPAWPVATPAIELPFQKCAFALPSRTGIVKTAAVEVIADRTAVAGGGEKAALDSGGCSDGRGGHRDRFRRAVHPVYPKRPAAEIARGNGSLRTIPTGS